MKTLDPHEDLMAALSSGNADAAQRVFMAYAPYLRMVVRRQLTPRLRSKFDSMDIIQSVWADLVGGFMAGRWQFSSPGQLRAFLVKATRNRFIDRVRQQQTPLRQELCNTDDKHLQEIPQRGVHHASCHLEAEETWQKLLALCPAHHGELLHLKRQGLTLAEIAARTGFHKGSVRRILYDLAARLATTSLP
jgi:RNA polymerase sigma-70 factor (ECF subfamily)